MELVPVNSGDELAGFSSDFSLESLGSFLDSQRDLFHSQVEQLQKIVFTQCKVTGVNPLSQEMAAGTLSIKIGKRPRDLLNPKAISYMQSIFSIKDMIGKKETREISAYCGATLTQVREFFAGQRSRVRKFIRVSREKAARTVSKTSVTECSLSPGHAITCDAPVTVQCADRNTVENFPSPSVDSTKVSGCPNESHTHCDSVKLENSEESTSCLLDNKINHDDNKFLKNIFKLMRKEEKFSGQMKLMEWIMQINDSAILYWFLSKGGMTILAEWLIQAATEEQTTIILFIFRVLCHLPLHKALPLHMSSILQTVNKLRFYRKSDISNKARFLLSRWSKLFVKGHVKKSVVYNAEEKRDDPLQLKVDTEGNNLLHCEDNSSNIRQLVSKQVLKLLPAPDDKSCRKQKHVISPPKNKVRRKVLFMEHSELTNGCRSVPPQKTPAASTSRPLSVDDIQKAKMRAAFMQNKSAKTNLVNNEKYSRNLAAAKTVFDFQAKDPSPLHVPLSSRGNDVGKPGTVKTANSAHLNESLSKSDSINSILPVPEKLDNHRLCWKKPPAIRINSSWEVGSGENSKEVEVQSVRNKREKEVLYFANGEIPDNPREPWDREMDFDDSVTPGIPVEQPADIAPESGADPVASDCPTPSMGHVNDNEAQVLPPITSANSASNITAMPDLELLAVLLNNPDLVFALTSGQGNGLTDSERFSLLDTLKKHGSELNGMTGAPGGIFPENHRSTLYSDTGISQTNSHIREPGHGSGHPLLQHHPVGDRDRLTSSIAGVSSEASAASVCIPENAIVPSSFLARVSETALSTSELTVGFKSTLQAMDANANLFPHNSTKQGSHGICATEHVSYREHAPLPSQSQTIVSLNHHMREVCDSRQTPKCNLQNVSIMYSAPPVPLNPSRQDWHSAPVPTHLSFDVPTRTHLGGSDGASVSSNRRRGLWINERLHDYNREHTTYLHGNQNRHNSFPCDSVHQVYDVSESEDWSFGRSPMRCDSGRYRSERVDGWKSRFNRPQPGNFGHRSYNNGHGRR